MRKEVKIGILAVVIIFATFMAVNFLKGEDLFTNSIKLKTVYQSVEGLSVSSPVTIQGYKVGNISDLSYNPTERHYELLFTVSDDFDIPSDSYLEVYSSDILGSKALRIVLGKSQQTLESGDQIPGRVATDLIGQVLSSLTGTKSKIDSLLNGLNTTVNSLNKVLSDKTTEDIEVVIREVKTTLSHFSEIAAAVNNKTPEIESLITNISSISAALDSSSSAIQSTIENAKSITDSIASADLVASINSLKGLLDSIQNENGTIGKLLTSDSLYNSITSLSTNLDSLVSKIERDPKKYIKISVF